MKRISVKRLELSLSGGEQTDDRLVHVGLNSIPWPMKDFTLLPESVKIFLELEPNCFLEINEEDDTVVLYDADTAIYCAQMVARYNQVLETKKDQLVVRFFL